MGQKEATGKDKKGFAVYPTPEAGWRGLIHQIHLYQQRGLTVKQTIFKYAPPIENDTNDYLEEFLSHLVIDPKYILQDPDGGWRLSPDTPLALLSDYALAAIFARKEGYFQETNES